MKVLYLTHEKEFGGATLSLLFLIDEMLKKKVEVVVSVIDTKGEFYDELRKRNVKVVKSSYYSNILNKLTPFCLFKYIIKIIINYFISIKLSIYAKYNKIDVIHTNVSVLSIGTYINRLTNIPHVWHYREFRAFNMRKVLNKTKKFNNKHTNKVIFISKSLMDRYEKDFDESKKILIYNGISNGYDNPKMKWCKYNGFKLLITADICENKNQIDAIKALSYLIKKGYTNIYLYLVGSHEKKYTSFIKDYIKKENIKNIYIDKFNNNMNNIRSKMDLELVCSKSEGFGRVTIEAMLSMLPVIGAKSDISATKELVIENYNGMLYEVGNYKELADKIEYLYNNRTEIKRLGINGYNYSKNFTSKKNAYEIYELYESILNNSSNGGV